MDDQPMIWLPAPRTLQLPRRGRLVVARELPEPAARPVAAPLATRRPPLAARTRLLPPHLDLDDYAPRPCAPHAAPGAPEPKVAQRAGAVRPPALPGSPAAVLPEPLSTRELELLDCVADGLSNREIAARLHISAGTVRWHLGNIFGKLGVQRRTQAVARARRLGLLRDAQRT